MSGKSRIVKWQKVREVLSKKKFSGEASPYGEWSSRSGRTEEGDNKEYPQANPDVLTGREPDVENVTRKILKQALREIKFSPMEKAVLKELSLGKTQNDVAKRLNISRSRVAQIILRVKKKGNKFYGNKTRHADDTLEGYEEGL